MHRQYHLRWLTAIFIGCLSVLSACQAATLPAATTEAVNPVDPTAAPTETALPAATATLPAPAPTSTPTTEPATPTKIPVITPLPGMALYTHPMIFDHIFQVDPAEWQMDPYFYGMTEYNFLRHRTLTNCRIVPTQGRGGREDVVTVNIGLYSWEILFYAQGNPYQPALGGPLAITFYNYVQKDCERAINTVLKDLVYEPGAHLNPGYQPYQTPVPYPTVIVPDCSAYGPAYFQAGDRVRVLTAGVWLRSAANQDEESRITLLTNDKDWQIEITGGPTCWKSVQKGDRIFWPVKVNITGGAEQTGWLMQGDGYEPYLVPVDIK